MKVTVTGDEISNEEVQAYMDRAIEKYGDRVSELKIEVDGEYVNLDYTLHRAGPFKRLRRITGYLVGTLDRWNNGKRAEEHDRVKHGTGGETDVSRVQDRS